MIQIYTDGSTLKNGSDSATGGFGVVVLDVVDGHEKIVEVYSRRSVGTTNNREEMKAIIWALNNYGDENPVLYSDSMYSINTFETWMWSWKRNGWIKSNKKTPENLDLIQLYDIIYKGGKRLNFHHVKGHNGNKWNEVADQLATGKITPEEVMNKFEGEC